MTVLRIVANIATSDISLARAFYGDVLGMALVMDHGWIATYASGEVAAAQVSVASEGGAGTAVPDLSVEVDDLEEVHRRAVAGGFRVEYGPVDEP